MGGRRQFGSIRQLASGRYQARYRAPDGQSYSADVTFTSRSDANVWLSTIQADLVRGVWRAPRRAPGTVASYVEQWISERKLKKSTRDMYEDLLRLHIAPTIGRVMLAEIDSAKVRTWHVKLRASLADKAAAKRQKMIEDERPFSIATRRDGQTAAAHAYRLLRAAMNTAVDDELITRNPCRVEGASVIRTSERPVASVDEVLQLAAAVPARYRLLILLAAFVGIRYGELRAMRRCDVDDGKLRIAERLYISHGALDFDLPKSQASIRTLPAVDALSADLAQHLKEFVGPGDDALLFTTASGLPLQTFYPIWNRARLKVGRPDLRLHDLRHTGQTLAALSGATEAELMHRMGHSTTAASRVYTHSTAEHAQAVSAQLSRVISAHQAGDNVVPLRPVARRKASGGR